MRLAIALFLLWPALASAQNLIPFSSFDSSSDLTNGWSNLGAGKVWSSTDVDNSSSSGSVLITNSAGAGSGVFVSSACVAVNAGEAYDFGAWHFMQALQPGAGSAQVTVQWYDRVCSTFLGQDTETSTAEGVWTQVEGQVVAPPGAGGAVLRLVNGKSSGGSGDSREIFFDEGFLPEPGAAASGLSAVAALLLVQRSTGAKNRKRSS